MASRNRLQSRRRAEGNSALHDQPRLNQTAMSSQASQFFAPATYFFECSKPRGFETTQAAEIGRLFSCSCEGAGATPFETGLLQRS